MSLLCCKVRLPVDLVVQLIFVMKLNDYKTSSQVELLNQIQSLLFCIRQLIRAIKQRSISRTFERLMMNCDQGIMNCFESVSHSVPANQLGDGGCGKELGIGGVAPVQKALTLPQALWAVLKEDIES